MKKRLILIAIFGVLALGLDQGTKIWAKHSLKNAPGINVIDNYLRFDYYENPGMAFSIGRNMPGARFIFIAVGIVVLVIVWRFVNQIEKRQRMAAIAYGLVAGGAIGNLIDRIYMGRVVDFIVMHWQRKYVWPAYNIADTALCIGVGLLVIAISGEPKPEPKKPKKKKGG